MKANAKAIHHVTKSNAFRADCGEDAPKHRTVWLKKVTCKRCQRVIEGMVPFTSWQPLSVSPPSMEISQIVARKRRPAR